MSEQCASFLKSWPLLNKKKMLLKKMWERFFDAKQWSKGPHSWTMQGPGAQPPINYFSQMDKFMDIFFFFKNCKTDLKNTEYAETNENSILWSLRFIVFEIYPFFYSKLVYFWWILSPKLTIAQKLKIWKIWKLMFLSIQRCAHISCKYGHFWGGAHIFSWK